MAGMVSQITGVSIVYLNIYSGVDIKENIRDPCHWPLWGEFAGHRWIPLIKASNAEIFPFDDVIIITQIVFSLSPEVRRHRLVFKFGVQY